MDAERRRRTVGGRAETREQSVIVETPLPARSDRGGKTGVIGVQSSSSCRDVASLPARAPEAVMAHLLRGRGKKAEASARRAAGKKGAALVRGDERAFFEDWLLSAAS